MADPWILKCRRRAGGQRGPEGWKGKDAQRQGEDQAALGAPALRAPLFPRAAAAPEQQGTPGEGQCPRDGTLGTNLELPWLDWLRWGQQGLTPSRVRVWLCPAGCEGLNPP